MRATTAIVFALILFVARAEETPAERMKDASPAARELMIVWDKQEPRPADPRHGPPRLLTQGSGFKPPASKDEWLARAKYLREQVLIAAGLWPLPETGERCALETTVTGKLERPGYSVEKVFFQSYPGFYVSGLLYRPSGKAGPFPGVLCPHGHWPQGRFTDKTQKEIDYQIKGGWEKDAVAARYPQQARCANLALLGCIVFQYDMVGYADSDPQRFPHRKTWLGPEYEMNGISIFGLQLWDSMRALDFLESLPDVDKSRLACTGESGGATQTFTLMATDGRLACAAPVCMISAGDHQGGCVCENAALLRVFTDNVELAATFAPKPFIHPSATGDWTKDFMEKGFPEIKAVYKLFGAENNVAAMRQKAEHNYNLASREAVYNFFNEHLKLGSTAPVVEAKFEGLTPAEMAVFDAGHPRPAAAVDPDRLKKYLAETTAKRITALMSKDPPSLAKYREVLGAALEHMCAATAPTTPGPDKPAVNSTLQRNGITIEKFFNPPWQIPTIVYRPDVLGVLAERGVFTIVVMPQGKAELVNKDGTFSALLAALLARKHTVCAVDLFGVGENAVPLSAKPPDYGKDFIAGYNPTTLANRVNDLLATIRFFEKAHGSVNLIGIGDQGTACILAAALSNGAVARVAVDADRFDFDRVKDYNDPRFLPSAARFGGIWPFAGLIAPSELFVFNTGETEASPWLKEVYESAVAAGNFKFAEQAGPKEIVEWMTRAEK